jgi:hypothetical protein
MLKEAGEFVRRDMKNAIVAHCRGGKGRTGSLCCAWLLYSRHCEDGLSALSYFAETRSDLRFSSKLQGVDTPSQKRYVVCLHRLLSTTGAYLDTDLAALKDAPETPIQLTQLTCLDFFAKPHENDLVVVVTQAAGGGLNWSTLVESLPLSGADAMTKPFELGGVTAAGDIRVSVYDKKKRDAAAKKNQGKPEKRCIAGKEPGIQFYFILHTAFLDTAGGQKEVGIDMMDKAWKDKKGKYNKTGIVRMSFNPFESTLETSLGDPFGGGAPPPAQDDIAVHITDPPPAVSEEQAEEAQRNCASSRFC